MTDTIIKGTGNSRTLRTTPNALTMYPTYADMITAMVNGTFPIDLGPLNLTGIDQRGTDLIKETLLSDSAEIRIWGNASNRTVDQALLELKSQFDVIKSSLTQDISGKAQVSAGIIKTTKTIMSIYTGFKPRFFIGAGYLNGTTLIFRINSVSGRIISLNYPLSFDDKVQFTGDGVTVDFTIDGAGISVNYVAIG